MTAEQKVLKQIFSVGIDGQNSNNYFLLLSILPKIKKQMKKLNREKNYKTSFFSLCDLEIALKPLSKKWDKEIDKIIELTK